MRRWEEDRRASRKDPLKIDLTEYRVRVFFICALTMVEHYTQRANKAEFDRLVLRAKGKAASSDPNAKGSGSERDTILVTSDIEG